MRTAFVLGGGGAKGAFQAGVLYNLKTEHQITPDAIYGTSIGALNGYIYSRRGYVWMKEFWTRLKSKDELVSLNWFRTLIRTSKGLYSSKPLRSSLEWLEKGLRFCKNYSCTVDLRTRDIHYIEDTIDGVLGSVAIPGIIEPIEKDGQILVDGTVREAAPLRQAIRDGYDRIVIVLTRPLDGGDPTGWDPKNKSELQVMFRAVYDTMIHEIYVNDIKLCQSRNGKTGYRDIELMVYAPENTLDLGLLEFDHDKIKRTFEMGRKAIRIL